VVRVKQKGSYMYAAVCPAAEGLSLAYVCSQNWSHSMYFFLEAFYFDLWLLKLKIGRPRLLLSW